jgi:hypothetical protein
MMLTDELNHPVALLMARVPRWLWDLLLKESKRRGTGYMRLTAAALERELLHSGEPVEGVGTGPPGGEETGER